MKVKNFLISVALLGTFAFSGAALAACGGNEGKPLDPVDESGFSGGTKADLNLPLETDADMTVDGNLNESKWSASKPLIYNYPDNVTVSVKTVFGDKGIYVGFDVRDKNIFGNPDRGNWHNSGVEMYIGDAKLDPDGAVQYRHDVCDFTERFKGKYNDGYVWEHSPQPVYSQLKVDGTVNGEANGLTCEVFIRYDAISDDYDAEGDNADFEKPQSIVMMPAYNRASGFRESDARQWWCTDACSSSNPETWFSFGVNGYLKADSENAVVGTSQSGRNKTFAWNVTGEGENETATAEHPYAQTIFFRGIDSENYAATALLELRGAVASGNAASAGMIAAANLNGLQTFELQYGDTPEVVTVKTTNPYRMGGTTVENEFDIGGSGIDWTGSKQVRLTAVKRGADMLLLLGDATADNKYEGTPVAVWKSASFAGSTAPGLIADNCAVTFSDYAVTTDADRVNSLMQDAVSTVTVDNMRGGNITSDKAFCLRGDRANISIEVSEGYRLTKLLVNGADRLGDVQEGVLQVECDGAQISVVPKYEALTNPVTASGAIVLDNDLELEKVSITVASTSDQGMRYKPQLTKRLDHADGASDELKRNTSRYGYEIKLPEGEYTVAVTYDDESYAGESFVQSLTVTAEGGAANDVTLRMPYGESNNGSYPTSGLWIYDGETYMIENGTYVLRSIYQKNVAAKQYIYSANVTRLTPPKGISTPRAGIVIASVPDHMLTLFVSARAGATEWQLLEVRQNGAWNFNIDDGKEMKGSFALASEPDQVNLRVVRSGGVLYMWINDSFIGTLAPEWMDGVNSVVGLMCAEAYATYSDMEYSEDKDEVATALDGLLAKITVNVNGENGSCEITPSYEAEGGVRVPKGRSITLQFIPAVGYALSSVKMNGVELAHGVWNNTLTLGSITADTTIDITYLPVSQSVTVTGSYAFGDGMDETKAVRVFIGDIEATVNTADKTYTATVPAGVWTLRIVSDCYADVYKQVTVPQEGGALETLAFTRVRLESYTGVSETVNGGDVVWNFAAGNVGHVLGGVYVMKEFGIWAEVKADRAGNYNAPAFYIEVDGVGYNIILTTTDRGFNPIIMRGGDSEWLNPDYRPEKPASATDGFTAALYFRNGEMAIYVNGEAYENIDLESINEMNWNGSKEARSLFTKLFDSYTVKRIGFGSVNGACSFKNAGYTTDRAEITKKIEGTYIGLTLEFEDTSFGSASLSETSVKLLRGESVLTVDPGVNRIFSVTVGGRNVTADLVKGEGTAYTYTITGLKESSTVVVKLREKAGQSYTVAVPYEYADGLYKNGDTVTVKGVVEHYDGNDIALTDFTVENNTVKLPDGSYTITLASSRFADVTVEVTVNGADVSTSSVQFTRIKLADTTGVTASDGTFTFTQNARYNNFAGVTSNAFTASASMTYTVSGSYYHAGGISVTADGHKYQILPAITGAGWSNLVLICEDDIAWNDRHFQYDTSKKLSDFINDGKATYDITVSFTNGLFYIAFGRGATVSYTMLSINDVTGDTLKNAFAPLFADNQKSFGLASRDMAANTELVFTNVSYSVDGATIARMIGQYTYDYPAPTTSKIVFAGGSDFVAQMKIKVYNGSNQSAGFAVRVGDNTCGIGFCSWGNVVNVVINPSVNTHSWQLKKTSIAYDADTEYTVKLIYKAGTGADEGAFWVIVSDGKNTACVRVDESLVTDNENTKWQDAKADFAAKYLGNEDHAIGVARTDWGVSVQFSDFTCSFHANDVEKALDSYTVTVPYTYADGIYDGGDTVTVKGVVIHGNGSDVTLTGFVTENNTVKLPNGSYTITLASSRFADVTVEVTVNGADVSTSSVQFTRI